MSSTEFGVNDAQTVKHWSRKTLHETFGQSYFRKFVGKGRTAIIQMLTELEKGPGDTVRYDLRTQNRAKGVAGDSEMRGYEQALNYYQDSVLVNQLRQAHEFGQTSQQRTVHDLREDGKASLAEWWRGTFDATTFAYLAGTAGDVTNDAVENEAYSLADTSFAGNTLRAATNTIDGSAGDFDLSLIPRAIEMAKTLNPKIEPTMVDGEPKYVLVLHPYSVASMHLTTGESQWAMIQQRAAARGSKNPIYTGALGEYLGVVLHESEFVPRDADDLTYNLFLGANAGAFAMANAYKKIEQGQSSGGGYFKWHEDTWDYGNRQGVSGAACWGVQKSQFNSIDRGVITIETTDASHATVS